MITKLMAWRGTEPVRLFVWPAIIVLVGLGLTKGILDGDTATALYALIPLVLGIPAEIARANVTPVAVAVGKHAAIETVDTVAAQTRAVVDGREGAGEIVDSVTEQIKARIRGL